MSRDDAALLAAVLADPDADDPRLTYAAGTGDAERAEFIRNQVEAAQLRRKGHVRRAVEQAERAKELLAMHRDAWAGGIGRGDEPRFYRGFVEGISITSDAFLARMPQLVKLAPIRHVRFTEPPSDMAALAASPHLARLASISFFNQPIGDLGVETLMTSPHLGNLRLLDLGFTGAGMDSILAILSANPPRLAHVAFAGNKTDSPVETFGVDAMSGAINASSIYLPPMGERLEKMFGRREWLHAPSLLPQYPPLEADF